MTLHFQPVDRRGPPDDPPSVSDVTARIKDALEGRFADVWVAGEVSNLTRASSGHVYLSLKDDTALLRGVIWRTAADGLAIEPVDGMAVVCHGRLEVYPPRGTYQITIDRLHALGMGALEAQLRKLHATLAGEGLFAAERKRPIPAFPRRIAVVTSPTGAAIADFLRTLRGRWRATEVIVVPSRVQGAGAAAELAAALATAARLALRVDVIALVRGGGSLEDLWSFNEEVLVRAVAASPVPVVAGVGHEIDVTLADLAADLRALTPTDAAVKVSPDGPQVEAAVAGLGLRLAAGLARRLGTARERVVQLATARIFSDPGRLVRDRRDLLTTHALRLRRLAGLAIDRAGERLAAAAGRLEAASPLQLLARGWSLTWRDDDRHQSLRSVAGLTAGTRLITRFADGSLQSRVEQIMADEGRRT
ncbi:MAG: exodeoxyribonuclease VII large subunit [Planctomycetes bacterium]|nr:exodeoxyribonuclease VII large subunit [Planctomycetota bacterium]